MLAAFCCPLASLSSTQYISRCRDEQTTVRLLSLLTDNRKRNATVFNSSQQREFCRSLPKLTKIERNVAKVTTPLPCSQDESPSVTERISGYWSRLMLSCKPRPLILKILTEGTHDTCYIIQHYYGFSLHKLDFLEKKKKNQEIKIFPQFSMPSPPTPPQQ